MLKRVGIIRGGPEKHYSFSLRKGGEIISHIHENLSNKYKIYDILVDKNQVWHLNGKPINPADLMQHLDVAWNTSHPSLSNILESLAIPHVSGGFFSGSLINNREYLEEHLKGVALRMPRALILPVYQQDFDGPKEKYAKTKAQEVWEKFPAPWIVRSYTPDSSMGIHLAKTFPELERAIEDGLKHEKSILVEEFIAGRVTPVYTVPKFRNEEIYTFPIDNTFDVFAPHEKEELYSLAKKLHRELGAKHYLKSDWVVDPRGKAYLLQIESTPDLRPNSHFANVCESIGAKMYHVVDHMLERA